MSWQFTSDGEPTYYDCPHMPEFHGKEMEGYRPGTVAGEISEHDLWCILVGLYFWMNTYDEKHPEYSTNEPMEGYLWKCEAQTRHLYDSPDNPRFDPFTQRIVCGAFATVDELGWMGFSAVFSGEYLCYLLVEVDTEWNMWVSSRYDWEDTKVTTFKLEGIDEGS